MFFVQFRCKFWRGTPLSRPPWVVQMTADGAQPAPWQIFSRCSVFSGIPFGAFFVTEPLVWPLFLRSFAGIYFPLLLYLFLVPGGCKNNDFLGLSTGLKCCKYKQQVSFSWFSFASAFCSSSELVRRVFWTPLCHPFDGIVELWAVFLLFSSACFFISFFVDSGAGPTVPLSFSTF